MNSLQIPHLHFHGSLMVPPFKVVAVDDTNKPNEIPLSLWIEHDQVYTVKEIRACANNYAFVLEEIDVHKCFPFEGFSVDRFIPL